MSNTSKLLSYLLRHAPDFVDQSGWVDVDQLLEACGKRGHQLSRAQLDQMVATNDKQRFTFSPDGRQIRANQGHSVPVELDYQPVEPPAILFHGTVERFLPSIFTKGLVPMNRHHVHLSADRATARTVGSRRGEAVVLQVDSRAMHEAGYRFFRTPNGVWLTDAVPVAFIRTADSC